MKDNDIEHLEKEFDIYFINDIALQDNVDKLYQITYGKNISKSQIRKFLVHIYRLKVLGLIEYAIKENWSDEKVESEIENAKARLQRAINRISYENEINLKSKDEGLKSGYDYLKDEIEIIASGFSGLIGLNKDFDTEFLESYLYTQIKDSLKKNPKLIEDIREKLFDYFENKQKR